MIGIIGSPRSGTSYALKSFDLAGYSISGEWWDGTEVDVVVSWRHIDYFKDVAGHEVYHLVRNPINVINSLQTISISSFVALGKYAHIPANVRDPVLIAAHCWLGITNYVDAFCNNVIRIDDFDEWLRIKSGKTVDVDKNCNTRKGRYKEHTIDDLIELDSAVADKIIAKEKQYGYQ